MKEDEGEKFTFPSHCLISCEFHANVTLSRFPRLRLNRDKETCPTRAEQPNISLEEANKLRSQAVVITFGDVIECINVSGFSTDFILKLTILQFTS